MDKIFLEILNHSIAASYLIIAVVMIRFVLKKLPKWSLCLLWAMVAIRLVIPLEIESVFSLLPNSQGIKIEDNQNKIYPTKEEDKDAVYEQYLQNVLQENKEQTHTQKIEDYPEEDYEIIISEKNTFHNVLNLATYVWIAGILVFLIYAVVSIWRLKQKIATRIPLQDNIYLCDEIESPFVMGVFKPCIYLSSNIPKDSYECILKHESAHIKRADHIWKFVGYIILMIYWFHPLSWIAYLLFCNDMELACDEKATKDMDKQQRIDYCEALLQCSMKRNRINVCPVAFGEVGVKERIKQVLNYKKPSFRMILLAVVICIVISVCFMTSPKNKEDRTTSENMEVSLESTLESDGQKTTENITEYDHIQPDERGFRWLSDEVYVYEFEDLDQNGVEEYAKVYQVNTEQEYSCRYIFYWNGEPIYKYENSYGMSPGEADYLDLDGDGNREVFLTFWPHANSMPLMEYIVLKQKEDVSWVPLEMIQGEEIYQNAFPISITKGENEWEAVISCEGFEKTVTFDIAFYHSKLLDLRKSAEPEEAEYLLKLANDYKYGFPKDSEWYTFGSVCAWGIWNIRSAEYQGKPCLIATHGIQGFDKFDFWGELDVYFDYDEHGKTRFLDMEFRNSESWAGKAQQAKIE